MDSSLLVVGLSLDPGARWKAPHGVLAALIIDENSCTERQGWKPPVELEGVHAKALVHPWSVRQEGSQASLKDQTKVEEVVFHSLCFHTILLCYGVVATGHT